jgi:uncharacterized protein YndB with AHSA1/START domain
VALYALVRKGHHPIALTRHGDGPRGRLPQPYRSCTGAEGAQSIAMRFENKVTIGRSPAEVFAYLADFENVPTWNYAIVETRTLSEGPVRVGTRYRQVRKLPRPSEESFQVTELEPETRLSVEGTFGPFPGRFSYFLEAVAEGTRVTNVVELKPSGVLKLVGGLATSRLRSAVGANLDKLKELLESGL